MPRNQRATNSIPSARRRNRRRNRAGQTTIEFSFAFILLLLGIFGSISSAVWAIESMAAISATETTLRILSSAAGPNALSTTTNAAATNANTLVTNNVLPALKPAMFGTQVVVATPIQICPPTVTAAAPTSPRVVICAQVVGGQVRVRVIGCASSMVPPAFGLTGCKYGVPINDFGAVQGLVFTQ